MSIRIDGLPTTTIPSKAHEVPAMKDELTVKLTVAQILALIEKPDFIAKFNAEDVVFTPVGNISAATIQAALAELDTEKIPVSGGVPGGIIDLVGNTIRNVGSGIPGYVRDLILSPNGNTAVDISTGEAKGNNKLVINSATITANLALNVAGGGHLDTGAKAINTWYHVHACRKQSDNSFFPLYSTSPTTPTVPVGYDLIRRIAAVKTNASGNIIAFKHVLNRMFIDNVTEQAYSASAAKALRVVTAPLGVSTRIFLTSDVSIGSGASNARLSVWSPLKDTSWGPDFSPFGTGAGFNTGGWTTCIETNTSSQIYTQATVGGTASGTLASIGWEDYTIPREAA